jgi:N-methylhydantoinase B
MNLPAEALELGAPIRVHGVALRRDSGSDGAMARTVIHRAGGGEEVVPSKLVTTLHTGDRVVFETAGGGGYGDPVARDPAQVRADLADGKISVEGARVYGMPHNSADD